MAEFSGAKMLVFIGAQLLVVRRDLSPGIPWPGHLDFPGGGRDGRETPWACARRETREEVGLVIDPGSVIWGYRRRGVRDSYFFAAMLGPDSAAAIRFGTEGLGWALMAPQAYLTEPLAIPPFQKVLHSFLCDCPDRLMGRGQWPTGQPVP